MESRFFNPKAKKKANKSEHQQRSFTAGQSFEYQSFSNLGGKALSTDSR
jgi:hypothetical protein